MVNNMIPDDKPIIAIELLPPALTKSRALRCMKCDSNASPLFFGIEQTSFEPLEVRAIAWCRGCINLNPEVQNLHCG